MGTIIDRDSEGNVLERLPSGEFAWLRPETQPVEVKTATPADLLATPARFLRWLNEQPADATVGRAQKGHNCPIANFLTYEGFEGVLVGSLGHLWASGQASKESDNPSWVTRFVNAVDEYPSYTAIRASHARALLHQAVRDSHD